MEHERLHRCIYVCLHERLPGGQETSLGYQRDSEVGAWHQQQCCCNTHLQQVWWQILQLRWNWHIPCLFIRHLRCCLVRMAKALNMAVPLSSHPPRSHAAGQSRDFRSMLDETQPRARGRVHGRSGNRQGHWRATPVAAAEDMAPFPQQGQQRAAV